MPEIESAGVHFNEQFQPELQHGLRVVITIDQRQLNLGYHTILMTPYSAVSLSPDIPGLYPVDHFFIKNIGTGKFGNDPYMLAEAFTYENAPVYVRKLFPLYPSDRRNVTQIIRTNAGAEIARLSALPSETERNSYNLLWNFIKPADFPLDPFTITLSIPYESSIELHGDQNITPVQISHKLFSDSLETNAVITTPDGELPVEPNLPLTFSDGSAGFSIFHNPFTIGQIIVNESNKLTKKRKELMSRLQKNSTHFQMPAYPDHGTHKSTSHAHGRRKLSPRHQEPEPMPVEKSSGESSPEDVQLFLDLFNE